MKLSDFNLLQDQETDSLHDLIHSFNQTATEYPHDATTHGIFAKQAASTPDATAVVYEGTPLTYRELDSQSNALARCLLDYGVTAESVVGVMMGRSLDMIVALVGILKSGAAYLPINPDNPSDRIKYLLTDTKASILIS